MIHLEVKIVPIIKKAQHILIRRARGTMFRHHNNHIVIYDIGKGICLSNAYIFILNHDLRLTNNPPSIRYSKHNKKDTQPIS